MSAAAVNGVDGVVRIAIRATIFGAWAVHQSHDIGDDTIDAFHHGYVVTHVDTGRALPPKVCNHLSKAQAEAIAHALSIEVDAGDFSAPNPSPEAKAHARRIVDRILAESSL
jgi:hypothetical protein